MPPAHNGTLNSDEIKRLSELLIPMFRDAMRQEWKELRADLLTVIEGDRRNTREKFESMAVQIRDLEKRVRADEKWRIRNVGFVAGVGAAGSVFIQIILAVGQHLLRR